MSQIKTEWAKEDMRRLRLKKFSPQKIDKKKIKAYEAQERGEFKGFMK